MWLILKANINWRHKNLLISDKVAVIILDKYNDVSFRDIVLIEYTMLNKPLRYCCISLVYAVYILLYYILLFPCGNTGWYWGL